MCAGHFVRGRPLKQAEVQLMMAAVMRVVVMVHAVMSVTITVMVVCL